MGLHCGHACECLDQPLTINFKWVHSNISLSMCTLAQLSGLASWRERNREQRQLKIECICSTHSILLQKSLCYESGGCVRHIRRMLQVRVVYERQLERSMTYTAGISLLRSLWFHLWSLTHALHWTNSIIAPLSACVVTYTGTFYVITYLTSPSVSLPNALACGS